MKRERLTLKELAVAFNVSPSTVSTRIHRGHSLRDALTAPVALQGEPGSCFGVGQHAGQCGAPTVNGRYCARCSGVMAQWVREVRAA